jgi:hypothetical protein
MNRAEALERLSAYQRLVEASLKSKRFGEKATADLEHAARMSEQAHALNLRQYSRLMRWTGYVEAMIVASGAATVRDVMGLNAMIHQRHKMPIHPVDDHGFVL